MTHKERIKKVFGKLIFATLTGFISYASFCLFIPELTIKHGTLPGMVEAGIYGIGVVSALQTILLILMLIENAKGREYTVYPLKKDDYNEY